MGARISFLVGRYIFELVVRTNCAVKDGPNASSSLEDMPGYCMQARCFDFILWLALTFFAVDPSPDHDREKRAEVVSILEGAHDANISGGTFVAAGRDAIMTTTTVNNIVINLVDSEPLKDIAILDWLSAINYRMPQMANLEKAVIGTCLWFLTSHLFIQWLTCRRGILWGTGMRQSFLPVVSHLYSDIRLAGAGKTILAYAFPRLNTFSS